MTTTPQPTPETDAESIDGAHHPQFVFSDFARKLERERDEARDQLEAMRDAIKEAYGALEWTTKNMNPPFEWEPFTRANAALAKLQPFIKP